MLECNEIRRNQLLYKDIENTKKYQFSECVMYELAVRNAKKDIIYIMKQQEEYFASCNGEITPMECLSFSITLKNLKKQFKEKHFISFYDFLPPKAYEDIVSSYDTKEYLTHYLLYAYYYPFLLDKIPEDYRFELTKLADINQLKMYGKIAQYGYSSTNIYKNFYIKTHSDMKTKVTNQIKKNINRPHLSIPDIHNSNITLEINPNLPIKENLDFVKKMLEELQKTPVNPSTYELEKLFKYFNYEPKKILEDINTYSYKKIANMFFTYDYITCILEKVAQYNNEIYQDEDKSPYTLAKKIVLYKEDGIDNEYITYLQSQLPNLSKKTILDYYYDIEKLLEEYKSRLEYFHKNLSYN
jgi:hypothetical protein